MHNCDISLRDITKIEGHASLDVKVRNGKVASTKLKLTENRRFFEQIVRGQGYSELNGIVGRICGFCTAAHSLAALDATENAFGIEPSHQTIQLRELIANGGLLKSHALHLYFLALPDYLGKESALDFTKREHAYLHQALRLKHAGTEILQHIGGRALHMLSLRAGGFSQLPSKAEISSLASALEKARPDAEAAIELFSSLDYPDFSHSTEYIALKGSIYCVASGNPASSSGDCFSRQLYAHYLKEFGVSYSTAKHASFRGRDFMVGALARMNLNHKKLNPSVRKKLRSSGVSFPQRSPFANNVAQAVELLQAIDSSIDILGNLKLRNERAPAVRPRAATGYGLTEAPRGTLYHEYEFTKDGKVKRANIIVPTSQNQLRIEKDVAEYVPQLLHLPKKKVELELEKLVRAYDPCISCAAHFLRVNWR